MARLPVEEPPPPPNSVYTEMRQWEEGKLYNRFVERTRDGGSETDVFVAERVVKTWESWMVYLKQLGQGGFGCVSEMGVPTLDLKLAVKTLKLVSFFLSILVIHHNNE